jgi:hypothetical protein
MFADLVYLVEYNIASSSTSSDEIPEITKITVPSGNRHLDISNLEKSKTYEFSVKAKYANNDNNIWSAKSNIVQLLLISDNNRLLNLNNGDYYTDLSSQDNEHTASEVYCCR